MGDLRAVATIGALTTADAADLRAVATGGFLTAEVGNSVSLADTLGGADDLTAEGVYSSTLTDTLGAGEALLSTGSGGTDNAEGAGFSEALTVTASNTVSLTDGLGGNDGAGGVILAGILRLTTTGTDAAWYDIQSSAFGSNAVGNVVQILLKPVETSACGLNQGANLTLCDGRFRWTVWLRADALNIDGQAEVAVTLDDAPHWIVMIAKDDECRVSVDGREVATGPPAGPTLLQAATFGNAVDTTLIGA